tara:strand:+ start:1301 stop:1459 length:159 start_codon:yes stop_codon:yes gene_type:complete
LKNFNYTIVIGTVKNGKYKNSNYDIEKTHKIKNLHEIGWGYFTVPLEFPLFN